MLSNQLRKLANDLSDMWQIQIDYENNADMWWTNVHQMQPFSEETKELTHGNKDSIIIPEHEAQKFIDWASQIEGWHDDNAPDFAPEPLIYDQV